MVQMSQIITANVAALVLLLIVKLHMWDQYKAGRLLDIKLLSTMMHLTILECIFDTLVFWIDGKNFLGAREINYAGNIIYYILKVAIVYFWPLFIEYKITSSHKKVKKLATIFAMPFIAFGLMYFLPISPILKTAVVILSSCPVASMVQNYAEIIGQGNDKGANMVLLGTMTSIVTVPLICLIL